MLLANGHVNTKHPFAALVDDGVRRNGRFTGLAVADDEFALAAPNGDHAVDRLDAGLQRYSNRLALDDAGRRPLDGAHFSRIHLAFAVDRLAQRIDNAPKETLAHRHRNHVAGPAHGIPLADALVRTKHYDRNRVFFEVQCHTVGTALKFDQFVCHTVCKAKRAGDPIAHQHDRTGLALFDAVFVIFDLAFYNFGDIT
ncbi:hypothetical protein SDC9_139788 [bioreactor metagenome]|uniref:Uncharacterized protein n=1 Tax=bioreactor metagenome TaxID=1076179 RepID=A0A645DVM1_9ZZZZ